MNRLKFTLIAVGCLSLATAYVMAQRGGYSGGMAPNRGTPTVGGSPGTSSNDVGSGTGFRTRTDEATPSPTPTPKAKVSPTPKGHGSAKGKQNSRGSKKVSPSPTASPKS